MIDHSRWHQALRTAVDAGERAVLVTVAAANGSTPREPGAAMLVARERVTGTIGGGHLEFEALRLAREALETLAPPAQWLIRFPLAARLGQCCGGVATLSFATLDASARSWTDVVAACVRSRASFAVVGLVAPGARAGERLVVTADDARGTLGEGSLDSFAIAHARARLAAPREEASSGVVNVQGETLFVHVVRPDALPIAIFGNGHVGRALVQVLGAVPAEVLWIDSREHDFPREVPANVQRCVTDDAVAEVASLPNASSVIVMTHSHALDFDIVEAALEREDLAYLGLIGSKAKRSQFERRLIARGASSQALHRLTCPIGAGALKSKLPGVIAVAVAAELLALAEAAHTVRPRLRGERIVAVKRRTTNAT